MPQFHALKRTIIPVPAIGRYAMYRCEYAGAADADYVGLRTDKPAGNFELLVAKLYDQGFTFFAKTAARNGVIHIPDGPWIGNGRDDALTCFSPNPALLVALGFPADTHVRYETVAATN